jgi:signal transduction histidine kinase
MSSEAPLRTIAELITSTLYLEESTPISRVVEVWDAHPGEDGMAILGGPHVRYVSRMRFFHQLGKRFGYSLFEHRPVSLLAEEASTVEAEMEPVEVIALATQREATRIYDDIVVLEGGRFRGLVSVRSLLVHHKKLLANGIAERVLLEERNRQLQELNRAQADFMASLTQELCRPVHTMLGVVKALVADSETRARHGRSLDALVLRSQELLAIVGDLQDLAKLERGELDPVPEAVELVPLLEEAVAGAAPILAARTLPLDLALGTVPRHLSVDPLFLRRILSNLLATAASLTIESGLTLAAEQAEGELVIRVGGPGLRAGDAEESPRSGPGLRLSAARGLVGRLGGTLQLVQGDGSEYFRLALPAAD